jgi:hypothetical protein
VRENFGILDGGAGATELLSPDRLLGVKAPVERSGDASLLLGRPGAHGDLTRGNRPQVNLLLTLPHLSISVIYVL